MTDAIGTTPLGERLAARLEQLDTAYRSSMEVAVAHLARSGMADRARTTGDPAPDFALEGLEGAPVVLSALLERGPVVLSFFRGEWCSFCRLEMEALFEALPAIGANGASLVMVSPQRPTEALAHRSEAHPALTVVADPLNGVGLQYGLVFRMPDVLREALLDVGVDLTDIYGTDAWLLPIPATYVIHPDGTIALAHIDPDFRRRLEPGTILHTLAGLGGDRRTAPAICA